MSDSDFVIFHEVPWHGIYSLNGCNARWVCSTLVRFFFLFPIC